MKYLFVGSRIALMCCIFIVMTGTQVLAAGGQGDQGVLFAGTGIDWERSGTEPQAVPAVTVSTTLHFPPTKTDRATINSAELTVNSNCTMITSWIWSCDDVTAKIVPNGPVAMQFCGQWLDKAASKKIKIYALKAVHVGRGEFKFDPNPTPTRFTFACAADNPAGSVPDKEWNNLGAIGKCMLWPPIPPPSSTPAYGYYTSTAVFQACLRAVRADYCGDGVTHTKDTTTIDLYPAPGTFHVPEPAFLLEANWDEKGAICVVHARYASLPATCQRRFHCPFGFLRDNEKPGLIRFIGTEYHCILPPGLKECPPDDMCRAEKTFAKQLTSGLLMDDSLLQP